MEENHYLVPTQIQGLEKNITHSVLVKTKDDADDWFVDAKERLLDVNNWKKYSAIPNMDFRLTDSHGKVLNRKAHSGDHIRIEIQADATGFDWVTIEAIEYDDYPDTDLETFALRVRPCEHPANMNDDFVINGATSTIVIERNGKNLTSSYHGRNQFEGEAADNSISAWLGLSDSDWARLIKGLIE